MRRWWSVWSGGGFFFSRSMWSRGDQQLDAARRASHGTHEKGQLNDITREMHKYKAYDSRRA
jgi:hypothetical protein